MKTGHILEGLEEAQRLLARSDQNIDKPYDAIGEAIRVIADSAPKRLVIHGQRWFDKANGNTYHSARAYLDGNLVAVVPFQCGYDDHYLTTALEELVKAKILPELTYDNGYSYGLRQTCEELGIELKYSAQDSLKREVKVFGEVEV